MRIRTLDKSYEILLRRREERRLCVMVAREDHRPAADRFLLVEFKQEEDIRVWLPFCEEQKQNPSFDDFVEYFSQNGSLYLVFRYYEGKNIRQWLAQMKIPLEERLRTGKLLLQKMVFLNLPAYLQYEALNWQNLLTDESGAVCFCYEPYEPERFFDTSAEDIRSRLEGILTELFLEELEDRSCPSLEAFVEQMGSGAFGTYLEAFKAYEKVHEELLLAIRDKTLKPQSLRFRVWERIKRLAGFFRKLLVVLVAGALLGYLIYTLVYPDESGEPFRFEAIGTLEMPSGEETGTQ